MSEVFAAIVLVLVCLFVFAAGLKVAVWQISASLTMMVFGIPGIAIIAGIRASRSDVLWYLGGCVVTFVVIWELWNRGKL